MVARFLRNLISVGEGFPLPFVGNFILHPGGAFYEPPLCKGRCRAERGGGVVPDTNYLYFFPANATPLQSLRRSHASSLYTREPFVLCEHCGCAPCFSVGGIFICPRSFLWNLIRISAGGGARAEKRLDFVLDTSHQTRRALSARTLPLDKPIIFLYHKTNTPTRGRKEVLV